MGQASGTDLTKHDAFPITTDLVWGNGIQEAHAAHADAGAGEDVPRLITNILGEKGWGKVGGNRGLVSVEAKGQARMARHIVVSIPVGQTQ